MTSRLAALLLVAAPLGATAQQKITLPAQDKVLSDRIAPLFAIGAEDGEDWELLSGVRQVAFDAQDNLYVLDANNHRVLVFDANGKYLRKIGKKGGGPGELMAPTAMTINSDGNIVINDFGRQAFSLFKTDGTFIKNVTLETNGSNGNRPAGGGETRSFTMRGGMSSLEANPRGGVFLQNMDTGMPRLDGGGGQIRAGAGGNVALPAAGPRKISFNHVDLATGKPRTLYSFEQPPIQPKVDDSGSGGGERRVSVTIQIPTFTPPITYGALTNGGLAIAHEADYRVRIVDPNGTVSKVIERPIQPKKVTDRDKKIAAERQRETMRRGDGMVAMRTDGGQTSFSTSRTPDANIPSVDELLRTRTFLDYIPVINRIETDPLGRIWIQRTAEDQGRRGPVDIVSADGRYIGTLAKDRAPDAVSRTGKAAYIERDEELGFEQVIVKRLPTTWR